MKNQKGFTLIELMISMSILVFIMMGAYAAFLHYFKVNVITNERAIKAVLATQRIEEWKSVKGENFAPGVNFPIYTPTVTGGNIDFSRTVVSVPAVTQLDVDCTMNSTVTAAPGYSYNLIRGTFTNPGYGATTSCWVDPSPRLPGNTVPGNITFAIHLPDGSSSMLEMQMIDYCTLSRTQRVLINNMVKGSYSSVDLAPPLGKTVTIPLTSADTSTGVITVEIEQTNVVNGMTYAWTSVDDCSSGATLWSKNPGSVSDGNITTPNLPLPYTDTDTKCLSVYTPGSSGGSMHKTINTMTANTGDIFSMWVYLDDNEKCWFTLPGGSSNVVDSDTVGWQKLTRVMTAADVNPSALLYIYFDKLHNPNTSDLLYINEVNIETGTPANPNAVLTGFNIRSFIGFTDPDPTAGAPMPPPGSHNPYIITSSIIPSDSIPGAAPGWVVTVSVTKQGQAAAPVIVSNMINR